MLGHSTHKMTFMSILIGIMATSSAASSTPDEFAAPMNDALFSPLSSEIDRALTLTYDIEVNANIKTQIDSMQKINDVSILETQITNYLQRAYGQYNWLVFVAQDFNPKEEHVSINYFGKGITSNVIVGTWTVYWAATPVAPTDNQRMVVYQDIIKSQLSTCSSKVKGQFTASMVYKCLENSKKPVTSGRNPIANFIFTSSSPGPNTSIGNSPGLSVSSQRSIIKITWGSVVVIVIIM